MHLASTQQLLKILPTDDPDYAKIKEETKEECIRLFEQAVEQEKDWARYLFKDGSMIGLNYNLLSDYVEFIAAKRMTAVGLPSSYSQKSNPLPWTQNWISSSDVQTAPQEQSITSYTLGGIDNDLGKSDFDGFEL